MFVWQAERLPRRIDKFCARLSMRLVCPLDFRDAFTDERVRDDELRFPVVTPFGDVQRV